MVRSKEPPAWRQNFRPELSRRVYLFRILRLRWQSYIAPHLFQVALSASKVAGPLHSAAILPGSAIYRFQKRGNLQKDLLMFVYCLYGCMVVWYPFTAEGLMFKARPLRPFESTSAKSA